MLPLLGLNNIGFAQINSVQDGSWYLFSTWDCSPPCVPSSADEVIVNHDVSMYTDVLVDNAGSITVAAGGSLQGTSSTLYMTGGSFTNNGTADISYVIAASTATTITNNDSLRMDLGFYNLGTFINNGVVADVDSLANYGTFINNVGARIKTNLFYSEDSCVNNGNMKARVFGNAGDFLNNNFLGTVNQLNTGYFFNNTGASNHAALFGNLGYFENSSYSDLNITFDFYNGDTLLSSAFFWNDGFVGVGRNWFNLLGDTIDGDSGQFCIVNLTINAGVMLGTFDLCDKTPTVVVPGAPVIDANTGTISPGITFCAFTCKMVLSLVVDSISCSDSCDGKIVARIFGGSPPYTFLWENGSTADSIIGLCEGAHLVTVTDNIGDIMQAGIYLLTPAIKLAMTSTDAFCGDSNGTAKVVATAGNEPYTYIWNDFAGQTTQTATGLPPSLYNVKVTDSLGCSSVNGIVVGSPGVLTISLNVTTATCPDSANGSIDATVTGGTLPYKYQWEPGSGSGMIYNNLLPGVYTITVTDSNGCSISTTVEVLASDADNCFDWKIYSGITPNGDGVDDHWIINGLEKFDKVSVLIFNNRGIVVWESENYQNDWAGRDMKNQPLMEGIYYYVVTRPDEIYKGWIYLTR